MASLNADQLMPRINLYILQGLLVVVPPPGRIRLLSSLLAPPLIFSNSCVVSCSKGVNSSWILAIFIIDVLSFGAAIKELAADF